MVNDQNLVCLNRPERLLVVSATTEHGRYWGRALEEAGFQVELATLAQALAPAWEPGQHRCILLDVSSPQIMEQAVEVALRIKQAHPRQCVAYLADTTVEIWGRAGDAMLHHQRRSLYESLCDFLATGLDGVFLAPRLDPRSNEMCA